MTEPIKTPAQILNEHTPPGKGYHSSWIIPAMEEYAAQQVAQYRERVKELLDVLDHIANPVARLQKLAEEEGKQLNGIMALMITSDAHYYKNIAKTALEKYKLIDK